ncbi:hypothetical protein L6164_004255 [Bauhinia variegata]|uniref:Uncharacterized protein n=1 Tax=Bauhinia variegata TaxID=167791 RepID=A0ACB9Q6K4_BAUVA|nr:hypothetical protein L6164_004255 [Bauhinia variegata]
MSAYEASSEPRRVSRLTRYENRLTQYEKYQGIWMENMKGSLMLVASVIATMNFTIAINPPGGVWPEDRANCTGTGQICKAGTAVLGHNTEKLTFRNSLQFLSISFSGSSYDVFLCLCTISFSASLSIIILLICGLPLTNRLVMWMPIIAMCISVYFTAAAYIVSVSMLMKQLSPAVSKIILSYAVY